MAEASKKSESEPKMTESQQIEILIDAVRNLQKRVKYLEKALLHFQHTNTDDGSRHQNDGGWFD